MSQTISAQPISVSIQMDAQGFRDFAVFDVFHHRKSWVRPTIFAVIMLAFAGVCLSQIGKRPGAALLTVVLALIGIGLPASYFGAYFYSLAQQVKKMHFPRPFYRLELADDAFSIWMVGSQDKAEPTERHAWDGIHCAYRTQNAVYIYVEPGKAYLMNDRLDAAWEFLSQKLPAEKLHDLQK